MSTLEAWLQNLPVEPVARIDGQRLYRKTVDNLSLKASAVGGAVGGWLVAEGCWAILTSMFAVGGWYAVAAVVFFVLYSVANPVATNGFGCFLLLIGLLVFAGVLWFFNHVEGTGQSRAVLKDPHKAAEAMQVAVGQLGARGPTDRELARIVAQVRRVQAAGGGRLQAPQGWLVYDEPQHASFTLGKYIFLTRELIYSDHLGGLLAYELGRLQNGDGQMRLAVQQLVAQVDKETFPYQEEWVEYWRQQVYLADEFVAQYGLARELIRYLELYQPLDVAKAFLWKEEPYKAERIDRLERYLELQGEA